MAMSNEKMQEKSKQRSETAEGDPFNPAKPAPPPTQAIVEAPEPPPQSLQSQWEEKAVAYLISKGWEKTGLNARGLTLWLDPKSYPKAKNELVPAVTVPAVGGGTEVIMQWRTPPATWPCITEQAYFIQTNRDKVGESLDEVIERKEEELVVLKEKAAAEKAAAEKKDSKKAKVA